MTADREIPDSHVVCVANQFCDTAVMLYNAIPTSGPQALRVNAAFAIELYIKSLDCHWERHDQLETLGVDCHAITVTPNTRGHRLDVLFSELFPEAQQFLLAKYAQRNADSKYADLRELLAHYSDGFASDRYVFERLDGCDGRPATEVIWLATFFRDTVNGMDRVRVAS